MRTSTWSMFLLTGVLMVASSWASGVGDLAAQSQVAAKPGAPAAKPAGTLIDLNKATATDLQRLPGIGPRLAERILEYRQKTGGFKKIEELMNVRGIGEKNFLKLKPLITVTPVQAQRPSGVR